MVLKSSPRSLSEAKIMSPAKLSKKQCVELLELLRERFESHRDRHEGLEWADVEARLAGNSRVFWSLSEMERTGGEPDVIGRDETGQYVFCDCSAESPQGRRNICYDGAGQKKREKEGLPIAGNVLDMASDMGIEPLTEELYRALQNLGNFDTKSQSWLKTPDEVTKLGGAIFGDRRFGRVFVYHNTSPCFYGVRGFRGLLKV